MAALSLGWASVPRGVSPMGASLFMPTEQLCLAQTSPNRSMWQMLWYYWEPQQELWKPREGLHEPLACPWTESFDHLTGKKISMATEAGRDTSLWRRGGLDLSIHSHDIVQMQVLVLISTAATNHVINRKDFFNPSPFLITMETTPRSKLLGGSGCLLNECVLHLSSLLQWTHLHTTSNQLTTENISTYWPEIPSTIIDVFRETFHSWTSEICFKLVIHPVEVMCALLTFCEEKGTTTIKIIIFFPQAAQLAHYNTKQPKDVQIETFLWCIALE